MSPALLRWLLQTQLPPLLAGDVRRVEGPGYLAYSHRTAGPGSEIVRIDLGEGNGHKPPRGASSPLAARLARAVRRLDNERPRISGPGWTLSRVSNGNQEVIRLELKAGARYADRFEVES